MSKKEPEEKKISVRRIIKVNPKVITVELYENIQANIPINDPTMYVKLLRIADACPRQRKWYPLIFWLDEKGYVVHVLPYKMWLERQEKKAGEEQRLEAYEDVKEPYEELPEDVQRAMAIMD